MSWIQETVAEGVCRYKLRVCVCIYIFTYNIDLCMSLEQIYTSHLDVIYIKIYMFHDFFSS